MAQQDARSARIAELRAQAAREQAAEQRMISEARMRENLASGVLKAVEQVEETLEAQIRAYDDMENMGDEELEMIRERRIRQAKEQAKKVEQLKAAGHGEYRTITDEKQFFAEAKISDKLVVHFGRNATRRCEIVDGHLTKLARRHLGTKFLRIDAERSPFLADRLKIHTLPSIVLVKNGRTDHTLIGFEELGGVDDFTTGALEKVFLQYKIIDRLTEAEEHSGRFGKSLKSVRKGGVLMDDWED